MTLWDWLKNAGSKAINSIGTAGRIIVQGAKRVGKVIGQGINPIGNGVEGVWGKVKNITIVGKLIGNYPIGSGIDTAL